MNIDIERELREEAERVRARHAIDTRHLEHLAACLVERLAADRSRAEARILVLQSMLQPICGIHATARLLRNASENGIDAVRARVHSLYGRQVARMVEAVLKPAC
ncbi:MAG TPA: hypothetical protein VKX25_17835 [Bryobacteraceae bacterium]|jgi:hypothetical protein|nr:hypothetical protein [Bryobacteraceae bacterium]